MRHLPRLALPALLGVAVLAAGSVVLSSPARAGTPYLSSLSIGTVAAETARSPLCNLKECTSKNRCRGSQVLSHCDLSSGTCVTESCTR